eukprot:TRINITY_DN21950_c0_g1_i1.p1 TRINITY_DN21950_c0_g1~~TRINITY_DN21950_c0_g1_i1.p1  ORF type:complete len:163 (-),score=31.86 TRINITY_DN21950_c0_g1_i1:245-691(-)
MYGRRRGLGAVGGRENNAVKRFQTALVELHSPEEESLTKLEEMLATESKYVATMHGKRGNEAKPSFLRSSNTLGKKQHMRAAMNPAIHDQSNWKNIIKKRKTTSRDASEEPKQKWARTGPRRINPTATSNLAAQKTTKRLKDIIRRKG